MYTHIYIDMCVFVNEFVCTYKHMQVRIDEFFGICVIFQLPWSCKQLEPWEGEPSLPNKP